MMRFLRKLVKRFNRRRLINWYRGYMAIRRPDLLDMTDRGFYRLVLKRIKMYQGVKHRRVWPPELVNGPVTKLRYYRKCVGMFSKE